MARIVCLLLCSIGLSLVAALYFRRPTGIAPKIEHSPTEGAAPKQPSATQTPGSDPDFSSAYAEIEREESFLNILKSRLNEKSENEQFSMLISTLEEIKSDAGLGCVTAALLCDRFGNKDACPQYAVAALAAWYGSPLSKNPFPNPSLAFLLSRVQNDERYWSAAFNNLRKHDAALHAADQAILKTAAKSEQKKVLAFVISELLKDPVPPDGVEPLYADIRAFTMFMSEVATRSPVDQEKMLKWLSVSPAALKHFRADPSLLSAFTASKEKSVSDLAATMLKSKHGEGIGNP